MLRIDPHMMHEFRLAVVIVNYRTPDLVELCLKSLAAERPSIPTFEVVVVDGGSGDGSHEKISNAIGQMHATDWVSVLPLDFNGGFGWANNQATLRLLQKVDPPDYIYFLNPDTQIEPGAIEALTKTLIEQPEVGAVGSQLIENGRPVASAFRFPSIGREFLHGGHMVGLGRFLGIEPIVIDPCPVGPVDWVTGASFIVRSAALRQSGLFDHGFFLYYEEVELMQRIKRAGWQIWHQPKSRVQHIGGAATGVDSGATETPRARPAYWFHSRQRYFALVHGSTYAVLASISWLAGRFIWRLRSIFFPAIQHREIRGEISGMLANGVLPTEHDLTPAHPSVTDAINRPPFWSTLK